MSQMRPAVTTEGVPLRPGDVIVTSTSDFGGWWIRLWARLLRYDPKHNHVAMFTHYDSAGVPRGVEGRPGGFGQVDLRRYLSRSDTITNAYQPGRTDEQRERAVDLAQQINAIPYDWRAILTFATELLDRRLVGLFERAREWPEGRPPSHVVCSSALDWIYEEVGWESPGGAAQTRWTRPSDFTSMILANGWDRPAVS